MRALAILVLALASATAQPQWQDNGKPVADNEWRKSIAGFGAMLEFTAKPDELFAAWEKPGEYVNVPASVEVTHRNEVIVGVVFFTGCKPNAEGNCDATVDYLIVRPDGSTYGDLKGGDLWKNKRAPTEHALQLAAQPLGVRIEPTDPLGEYTVTATIRDLIAEHTLTLVRKFKVEAVQQQVPKP